MNNVWRAAAEENFVEQTRCEGVCFAVGEGEDEHGFGEAIDDSKRFCFAGRCCALALKAMAYLDRGLSVRCPENMP